MRTGGRTGRGPTLRVVGGSHYCCDPRRRAPRKAKMFQVPLALLIGLDAKDGPATGPELAIFSAIRGSGASGGVQAGDVACCGLLAPLQFP